MGENNFRITLRIFIKNHLRVINKKLAIVNMILFALPLFFISYFMRNFDLGFRFITLLYIGSFIFLYFRKVLTGLFIFDDYENYLGFPVRVKDIAFSKFIVLNFEVGVQLVFLLLGYIFDGMVQGQVMWYYLVVIIGYFMVNFLLLFLSFLVILIYYKIKNLLLYYKIFSFREIIEAVSKREKTYKNKKYSKQSKVKTLAIMDIKKVLRNKKILLGYTFNTVGLGVFTIITIIFVVEKFPLVSLFTLLIILAQVAVLGGLLPLIAFSKCEYDQEFVLIFPVERKEYIKAKILSTIFFQLPIFILMMMIIFISLDINLFYKLIAVIVVGVNIVACVVLGVSYDGKHMEFGISLDDLSYKRVPVALGNIVLLSMLFGFFYLGPLCLTWISIELCFMVIGFSGLVITYYFYKKCICFYF